MQLPGHSLLPFWLAGGVLCGAAPPAEAASLEAALSSITPDELRQHVSALASDLFEGREAGSRGGQAAGAYLHEALQRLDVQAGGENGSFFQEFGGGYRNLLLLVPGADPELNREFVLVSAHYDHVGYGTPRNSLGPIGYIHNGADDNASGTAALLELAQALAPLEPRPRRSVLLAFWDAEEKGLLGSEHWVSRPTVPLQQIRLMINMDMIGRLRDDRVEVWGTRTAAGLRKFVSLQNRQADLSLDFNWTMTRESDHYSFYQRGIPCLMLHTYKHDDYHRPGDDIEKVNFEGSQRIAQFVLRLVCAAANADRLPGFRHDVRTESLSLKAQLEAPLPSLRPRLGIAWDREREQKGVLELTEVTAGSPADHAGLRAGDRILRFDGVVLGTSVDFRQLVFSANSPVEAEVQRSGSESPEKLTVELDGSPVRVGISWRIDPGEPEGIVVVRVFPGSPADLTGIRTGDRIYHVNGGGFQAEEFQRRLIDARNSPRFLVERNGRIGEVAIQLPER